MSGRIAMNPRFVCRGLLPRPTEAPWRYGKLMHLGVAEELEANPATRGRFRYNPGKGPDSYDRLVDFSQSTFWMYLAGASTFTSCDFSGVRFLGGNLGNDSSTIYRDCRFDRADLRNVNPLFGRFELCSFKGCDFRGFRSFYAEFVGCRFGSRIMTAKFFGRPEGLAGRPKALRRTVNEFRGNDFREAELIDTSFMHGIDIDAQLWSEADIYIKLGRIHERLKKARAEISKWTDAPAQREALLMLKIHEADCQNQDGLFARRDDVPITPGVRDRVWQLLADN
jgi:hypothetical protein